MNVSMPVILHSIKVRIAVVLTEAQVSVTGVGTDKGVVGVSRLYIDSDTDREEY